MKKIFLLVLFSCTLGGVFAQNSFAGKWKTIDDETGQAKSYVEIWKDAASGIYYGRVTQLLQKSPDTKCDKCSGERKNQPVVGMIVVWDLREKDGFLQGGRILDPNKGTDYGCSMWFENNNANEMIVRGKHWSGIYRTQKWYRL